MKITFLIVSTIAISAMLGFEYTGGVDSFSARPDGDGVTLEWRSQVESGIKTYTVERSDVRANDYTEVATVSATGNYSYYKYHDGRVNAAQMAGQSNQIHTLASAYKYRLRMNLTTGELSYSQTVNVTTPSSGVRRTWGMIKEMFH